MTAPLADRPTEQDLWAGPYGQIWLAHAASLEATIRPIGDALLQRATLAPGQHVIDVGCGAGAMSLDIARRVSPGGSVTGLDISPALVQEAQRLATAEGLTEHVRFLCADAARSGLLAGTADTLVSRFGIMFFSDPHAAFQSLRSLLRPGGRLAVVCWQSVKANPLMLALHQALSAHMEMPEPPPRSPGPWAFEDPDYVRDILTRAGFMDVALEPWQTPMPVGGPGSSLPDAVHYVMHTVSAVRKLAGATETVKKHVEADLLERLRAYVTPEGVRVTASVWFATARA